jgi:hypothetical protein
MDNFFRRLVDALNKERSKKAGKAYNLGLLIRDLKGLGNINLPVVIDSASKEQVFLCENEALILKKDGSYKTKKDVFMSWRGSYNNLSLSYKTGICTITSKDFLKYCEKVCNKTYVGYKGGEFTMCKDTPVYIANYGETDFEKYFNEVPLLEHWKVVGIQVSKCGKYVEILTDLCEIYSNEESFATLKSLETFKKQGK